MFTRCSEDTPPYILHSTRLLRETNKPKNSHLGHDCPIESWKKGEGNQTNMKLQSKSNSGPSGPAPDLQPFISQSSYRWLKACLTFTTVRPLARPCSLLLSFASTANIQFSSHLCHEVRRGCTAQTHWLQAKLGFHLLRPNLFFLFPFSFLDFKSYDESWFFFPIMRQTFASILGYLDMQFHFWLCVCWWPVLCVMLHLWRADIYT